MSAAHPDPVWTPPPRTDRYDFTQGGHRGPGDPRCRHCLASPPRYWHERWCISAGADAIAAGTAWPEAIPARPLDWPGFPDWPPTDREDRTMATLPDPATDPTGYVLAVADQVQVQASRISMGEGWFGTWPEDTERLVNWMLAEVALWRSIAERHRKLESGTVGNLPWCDWCDAPTTWPCPDLLAVVAAAKAYAQETITLSGG